MFGQVLYPGNYVPSLTHRFIKALENRGKLLRNFTQNIDGLGEENQAVVIPAWSLLVDLGETAVAVLAHSNVAH